MINEKPSLTILPSVSQSILSQNKSERNLSHNSTQKVSENSIDAKNRHSKSLGVTYSNQFNLATNSAIDCLTKYKLKIRNYNDSSILALSRIKNNVTFDKARTTPSKPKSCSKNRYKVKRIMKLVENEKDIELKRLFDKSISFIKNKPKSTRNNISKSKRLCRMRLASILKCHGQMPHSTGNI